MFEASGEPPGTTPAPLGLAGGTVAETLEWLAECPPSAEVQQLLEALDPAPMTQQERVLYAAAWERQLSAVQARSMRAQLRATTPVDGDRIRSRELLVTELAAALRRTDPAMQHALWFARRLHDVLPTTFGLLAAGAIGLGHAKAIEAAVQYLTPDDARAVDAEVAHRATSMTVSAFRRTARQAAEATCADAVDRHQRAKQDSGVALYPREAGMCSVSMTMPATDGVALVGRVNEVAIAAKRPDDALTHGQRQVAAVLDALLGRAADGAGSADSADAAADRPRRRTELLVMFDWASLVGLRDNPAELVGYGPIPAGLARRLAGEDGTSWRRLVFDDGTGVLLDRGTREHVDRTLRDLISLRDVTCRYPGCTRNAVYCDVEHCEPQPDGSTSCANCGLMCRRHHNHKTHDGFSYRRTDPATGETRWQTALGFRYTQKPASYSARGPDCGDTIRHPLSSGDEDPPF